MSLLLVFRLTGSSSGECQRVARGNLDPEVAALLLRTRFQAAPEAVQTLWTLAAAPEAVQTLWTLAAAPEAVQTLWTLAATAVQN